jgi:uncharacterized paraquat-inducible protein A
MVDVPAANGDQATAFIILASIVVPLALLAVVCWFFWTHRHDWINKTSGRGSLPRALAATTAAKSQSSCYRREELVALWRNCDTVPHGQRPTGARIAAVACTGPHVGR